MKFLAFSSLSQARMSGAAVLVIVALVLTGCIPGLGQNSDSDGGGSGQQQPPAPEVVESDGFWRPNTLGEPVAQAVVERPTDDGPAKARLELLSLDSDGTSARMVAAWLPPVDGKHLSPDELRSQKGRSQRVPWTRLADLRLMSSLSPIRGQVN